VQALSSLQLVPFEAAGLEHEPLVGSQVPATWHWSLAVQVTGFEPVQVPVWHAYRWLHLSVPVQPVPSGTTVCAEHVPVEGLQVPAT
jgi:hypothetical protein